MLFNKKIKVTAYTADISYFNTCKPEYQSNKKPHWLENLKSTILTFDSSIGLNRKFGTAAICPGIRDYLSTPLQINMWADVDIRINPDGSWSHNANPDYNLMIQQHHESQSKGLYNKRLALKLVSPWIIFSDSEVKWLFTESHYSTSYFRDLCIVFPPGVTNFYWQHSTNIHLNCPLKEDPYVITLKHGMPLVSLFPMTEREIEFDVKKVNYDEFSEMNQHYPKTFIGKYFKQPGMKR